MASLYPADALGVSAERGRIAPGLRADLVHLSDVLAGFAIGFLWLVVSLKVISRMEKYSRRKLKPIVEQPAAAA